MHSEVAGAWDSGLWLGDAAGPAPRLPRALLGSHGGCPHCGLLARSAARVGKPRVSFALCRSLNVDYMFPLRNTAFFKPGSVPSFRFQEQSHLLLFDLEAVPDQTTRPPVLEQTSQAHIVTSTQYRGHEVDFHYPAWFVPSFLLPHSVCACPWAYSSAHRQKRFCYFELTLEGDLRKTNL